MRWVVSKFTARRIDTSSSTSHFSGYEALNKTKALAPSTFPRVKIKASKHGTNLM